jgi:YgiT-type zinc finger domain-containing protein
MGAKLEKAQTKKTTLNHCLQGCSGRTHGDAITRVFRRTGSTVEVIVENIPADVCPVCGRAFFSKEVAQGIDQILFPFHGRHAVVPDLPPAKVIVDFRVACKKKAA